MGRLVKGSMLTIQPDRVLDKPFDLSDFPRWGSRKEARAAHPYKKGDVVWSKDGRRALVLEAFVDRVIEHDPISDLLPYVRVRAETVAGGWAKQWVVLSPGDLDRVHAKWIAAQSAENA